MSTARGFLGGGDLFIDLIVNGVNQGLTGPFLAEKFELKANGELREKTSKGRTSYGQIVASAAIAKPFDLDITLSETDKVGMAIALLGTSSVLTQTAGSLAAAATTVVVDVWAPTGKIALTGPYVVTNTAGTTTYVNGTDYLIDAQMGLVKILSTGAAAAQTSVKVSTSYAAVTGSSINGATQNAIYARFLFSGTNLADGSAAVCEVYQSVVASQAAVDLLSDQFITVPLKGRMVTPAGYTSPFRLDLRNV